MAQEAFQHLQAVAGGGGPEWGGPDCLPQEGQDGAGPSTTCRNLTAQRPISLGPQHLQGHRAAPSSHTSARPRNVRWGDSPGGQTQEHPPRAPPQGSAHTGPPAQGRRCLGFPLLAEWTWPPLPHTPCPEPCDRPHKQGRQSGAGHTGSQGQPTGSLSGGAGGADERGSPTDLSSLLALPSPCPLESVGTHSQGRTLGTCTTLAWAAEGTPARETRRFFAQGRWPTEAAAGRGPAAPPEPSGAPWLCGSVVRELPGFSQGENPEPWPCHRGAVARFAT